MRQATATVTRVGSFVAGLPNRNVYARSATGRTLSSVEPGPGRETPALTAAYAVGHVTVNPAIAFEGKSWEARTVGASTTWSCLRPRSCPDQHQTGRHKRNHPPPAHLPQFLAASLTQDRRRIEP